MAVIGKGELASRLAEKTGMSMTQANKIISTITETVSEALSHGDEVRLTGFGTFRVVQTKERAGRNPRTGQPLRIPAGQRVTFSASPSLMESQRKAA